MVQAAGMKPRSGWEKLIPLTSFIIGLATLLFMATEWVIINKRVHELFAHDGNNLPNPLLSHFALSLSSSRSSSLSMMSSISSSSSRDVPWDGPARWKPLDCGVFLRDVRSGNSTVQDPNNGMLYATLTKTSIPFWANVHNPKYDGQRWAVFETGVYYEDKLTEIFEEILREAPSRARVIDVGGNIGWFTMLSASMGHHVDAFEPNGVNLVRQCQSKWLNGWSTANENEINHRMGELFPNCSTVNIRPYGVSDAKVSHQSMFFVNPGMGSFFNNEEFFHPKRKNITELKSIPMASLDQMAEDLNWFNTRPDIVILKVDVEGYEPPVIAGAPRLLQSGMVQNLLMEMTGRKNNTDTIHMIKTILEAGFFLHRKGASRGPTQELDQSEHPFSKDGVEGGNIDQMALDLVNKFTPTPRKQINLWWKFRKV